MGDRYGKAAITTLNEQATHHISPNLQLGHSVQIFSAAYEWKWSRSGLNSNLTFSV